MSILEPTIGPSAARKLYAAAALAGQVAARLPGPLKTADAADEAWKLADAMQNHARAKDPADNARLAEHEAKCKWMAEEIITHAAELDRLYQFAKAELDRCCGATPGTYNHGVEVTALAILAHRNQQGTT